jgi:hypothetical protein
MAVAALGALLGADTTWSENWAWVLPLILLTVIMHVSCLGLIYQRAVRPYNRKSAHPAVVFIVVMGTTTLLATCLHGGEAAVWALAYRLLNALPANRSAVFAQSDHKLWPRQSGSGATLAAHGGDRSSEWLATVWSDHCVPVRP